MNPSESEFKAAEEFFRNRRIGSETLEETYNRIRVEPNSMAGDLEILNNYRILQSRSLTSNVAANVGQVSVANWIRNFEFQPRRGGARAEPTETLESLEDVSQKRKQPLDEDPEERRKRLQRERQQRSRANKKAAEDESQRTQRLAAEAERLRNIRERETPAQTSQRLAATASTMQNVRQRETPAQTSQRQAADADRHQTALERETPAQTSQRLAATAITMENVRQRETAAATESRRRVDAERHAEMRARDRERGATVGQTRILQQVDSEDFDETLVETHYLGPLNAQCRFCGALHFEAERTSDGLFPNCCEKGKVILPRAQDEHGNVLEYPEFLRSMMSDPQNANYRNFRENIRSYNSSVSFASMGAKIVQAPGRGPYCFQVNGTIYHRTSHLQSVGGYQPKYAQLYVLDSTQATDQRTTHGANVGCLPSILDRIDRFFRQNNRLCQTYAMMRRVMENEAADAARNGTEIPKVHMVLRRDWELDSRRFNLPTHNEVAMVFVDDDGEPPFDRDIRVYELNPRNPNYPYIHLNVTSPNLDPMTYAILYPYGEPGWHDGLVLNNNKVSLLQYKAYQTAIRQQFNPVMSAGKLTQQWVVDAYLQVEANNLNYIRTHQTNLRRELYQGLFDYVHNMAHDQGIPAGVPIILPSSFSGSPRNMREKFQDALAIFAKFGPMDAFITFTANPKWVEITENLKPGEIPSDKPELLTKVFHLKLEALLKDITENGVLGHTVAWVYTIEYQKRGLPHAHIIVVFHDEDKFTTPEKIDSLICAEIPNPVKSPRLYELVTRCMLHGPCGGANPDASCMEDGKCSKGFPKENHEQTEKSADGYANYRRRRGRYAYVRNHVFDNRHVVPYNKYLSLKYDCHINVEACTSMRAVKYIYKYIYKGFDCARVVIGQGERQELIFDEVSNFIDTRYVSAPEAMWRLMKYPMHDRSHAVIRLAVHLDRQQTITFRAGEEEEALRAAQTGTTTLTDWFRLNREDAAARQYLYPEIPYEYVFRNGKWKSRDRHLKIIPRMYTVSIKDEERFYLRMLLLHVRGATSYEDVRTVNGVVYETFKLAAIARHLLASDDEWRNCLAEGTAFRMPPQLRQQFAFMCIFGALTNANALWQEFTDDMILDYRRDHDQQTSVNLALLHIDSILRQHGKSCSNFQLPTPDNIIPQPPTVDAQQLRTEAHRRIQTLNVQQRIAFDAIIAAVNNRITTKLFYLNGPGGSGKTYLYTTLIAYLESETKTFLSFATTGIASTLIKDGRTVHSGFGVPLQCDHTSISNIKHGTAKAQPLMSADIILIDEITMMTKHILRVINELLKRLMKNTLPFGGKVLILGGDFRQTLPVIPRGTKAEILENFIKRDSAWRNFKELSLISNMRSAGQTAFNEWVLKVGNATTERVPGLRPQFVEIPRNMVTAADENIITSIFTDNISNLWEEDLASRVILCSTNRDCLQINNTIIDSLPGELKIYNSADSIITDDDAEMYTTEFMNSLQPSGMPPHELRLKKGTTVLLLRNLNPKDGLCNGTRLIVRQLQENFLICEIISERCNGELVFICRMNLSPSDTELPFQLKRLQFPILPAFVVTINRAQGQSYNHVGIIMNEPLFSHGQLYVALSRSKNPENIKMKIAEGPRQGRLLNDDRYFVENIVYPEVFQ